MTAVRAENRRKDPHGYAKPRIAPPMPARHKLAELRKVSADLGITLFPWQETAAKYVTAVGPGDKWLFPEVGIIVARQNGKTRLLAPLIVQRLLMGQRVMHTAQNRELPREVFGEVADLLHAHHWAMIDGRPRFANGQEMIRLTNGGKYRIVSSSRGGARGPSNDLVIVDELRELIDHDFLAAAKPTLMASANPQILYLSNAGSERSEALNALRHRADTDPSLAYLEWSAAPERSADDLTGWLESNPSIGHLPMILPNLQREHRTHTLAGTLAIFETENLCRWVVSMREQFVDPFAWNVCEAADLGRPMRPYMGVSIDPDGKRASAAMAWQLPDASLAVRLTHDVTGDPIDTARLGKELDTLARRAGVLDVGFDPMTDAELAKYFRKATPISGNKFANASARFALAVQGTKLRWQDAAAVTDDLTWTTRKPHDETGSFHAVRADDARPITAALAAVRAVWLASGPSQGIARIF